MSDNQYVNVVAGCVIERDGKYLLVQEKQEAVHGLWNLPAGKVDVGETLEQAAVREVREETGFTVELGPEINLEHPGADKPVLHAYRAVIAGGELTVDPEEQLDVDWFTLEEVRALHHEGKFRSDWAFNSIERSL